jgi:hypothetical protein
MNKLKYYFIIGFLVSVVGSILMILLPNFRSFGFALIVIGGIMQFLQFFAKAKTS